MKNKVINLIKINPNFFYNFYILKSSVNSDFLPNIKELSFNSENFQEILKFKRILNNKNAIDHKYNLVKNTFWKISGLNSLILNNLEKDKTNYFQ